MSKSVLILGGARFHGHQLAERLANEGHRVYVLNRGRFRTDYMRGIIHLKADRNNPAELKNALNGLCFDTVVDNNGYHPTQVDALLDIVGRNCGHYIFTSTAAVYMALSSDHLLRESEAVGEPHGPFSPKVIDYARGKFGAEEAVRNNAKDINFTILRFPNIFGEGDFLGKLTYFYHRMHDGGMILLEEEVRRFSLIYVRDAVNIIRMVMNKGSCYNETFNAADPVTYDYDEFFSTVYGGLYEPERIVFAPALKIWEAGYFLPLSWGPAVDVSAIMDKLPAIEYTPLRNWSGGALEWEIRYLNEKVKERESIRDIPLELELRKKFALCPQVSS